MNPILNLAIVLALLNPQEPGERVPIPAESPAERPELAPGTYLRLYDVATLTGQRRLEDAVLEMVETADPVGVDAALVKLERIERRLVEVRSTTDSLLASIREMISPELEKGIQRLDHLGRGSLALVGTAAQHEWLVQFLQTASGFDGLIDVQAHIFVLEPGQLAQLSRTRSGEVLEKAELVVLLRALEQAGVETVTSPRITFRWRWRLLAFRTSSECPSTGNTERAYETVNGAASWRNFKILPCMNRRTRQCTRRSHISKSTGTRAG